MDEWSLDIKNVDLVKEVPSKPEILTIIPPAKNEIDHAIEETKTDYFGSVFHPKQSEIKVLKTEIEYSPYLIVVGRYLARFLRENNYNLGVKSDVVSVKIKDEVLNVDNRPVTISSLIAKGTTGLTVGGGVIGFAFEPFEDVMQKGVSKVLGDHDISLINKKSVRVPDLLEHAIYDTNEKAFCFDASTASIVEKPYIWKVIKKGTKTKEGRPTKPKETLDFKKAIAETEKKLVKYPIGRILEHVFKISNLSFVFLPKINVTVQHKNEKKDFVLDGITLDVFKDKGFLPF